MSNDVKLLFQFICLLWKRVLFFFNSKGIYCRQKEKPSVCSAKQIKFKKKTHKIGLYWLKLLGLRKNCTPLTWFSWDTATLIISEIKQQAKQNFKRPFQAIDHCSTKFSLSTPMLRNLLHRQFCQGYQANTNFNQIEEMLVYYKLKFLWLHFMSVSIDIHRVQLKKWRQWP